jgi:hypothetical protein
MGKERLDHGKLDEVQQYLTESTETVRQSTRKKERNNVFHISTRMYITIK